MNKDWGGFSSVGKRISFGPRDPGFESGSDQLCELPLFDPHGMLLFIKTIVALHAIVVGLGTIVILKKK